MRPEATRRGGNAFVRRRPVPTTEPQDFVWDGAVEELRNLLLRLR